MQEDHIQQSRQLEYQSAQDMLKHYDNLNWHIGSILIAATLILSGMSLNKDTIEIITAAGTRGLIISFAIPSISFFVLFIWFLWFRRHRVLYNFRNETIHRLEQQLGMYHFLRVIESEHESRRALDEKKKVLDAAKAQAGHDSASFVPFYKISPMPGPSGYSLAKALVAGIPLLQLILFLAIRYA